MAKVFLEPFAKAYYFGEERVSSRYSKDSVQPRSTFKHVKEMCEDNYAGK